MFKIGDAAHSLFSLKGSLAANGYDLWQHYFTACDEEGTARAFFIEFMICNPALAGEGPTFGQLPENRESGTPPSYLMINAGAWGEGACAIHRFFSMDDVRLAEDRLRIEADDCLLKENRLIGHVALAPAEALAHPEYMSDSGDMSFDLKVERLDPLGIGRKVRDPQTSVRFWDTYGLISRYEGSVTLNGRTYTVTPASSSGYAGHQRGSDFADPLVFLTAARLVSRKYGHELPDTAFRIADRRAPLLLPLTYQPRLSGLLCLEGEEYRYDAVPGSKVEFHSGETDDDIIWEVRLENRNSVMEAGIWCKKASMQFLGYEAPSGEKRHNHLWSGGNGEGVIKLYHKQGHKLVLVDRLKAYDVRCQYGKMDVRQPDTYEEEDGTSD